VPAGPPTDDNYKWVALSNTTMAVFMSALDGSIVIISLPAIFRGIHLDPLGAGNISYLLWMIMGYRLVQAVLVVNLGRLGDMFGRVKIYNAGFAVFAIASVLLSFDPFRGSRGALWLIGWRVLQALGGSMLTANSAAILTDAFPASQRGLALGINQVAAIARCSGSTCPSACLGPCGPTGACARPASATAAASTGGATSPLPSAWARS
jgi:MFS family permease